MNLSIKHLRAFCALATERNFTRAAERCHLTQSAFSTMIRNLEQQAGVRLFHRSTRNVDLTVEGRHFETTAVRLLQDMEHALSDLHDHSRRRKGRVCIAALPAIAGGVLAPIIARYRALYAGIEVVLRDVTADTCLELMRAQQVDLALSASIDPGPDLTSEPLLSDGFFLVCRKDHPLAQRRKLTMDDVSALPMIRFEPGSSIRQHIDAEIYPRQPITEMEVVNPVTAAGLVAHGVGVTLVPGLSLCQFQLPELTAIPVALGSLPRMVCLIRKRDAGGSVAADAFIELLRTCLKNSGN